MNESGFKFKTIYKVERYNSWLKNTCIGKYASIERAEHEMLKHYLQKSQSGNFKYKIALQYTISYI